MKEGLSGKALILVTDEDVRRYVSFRTIMAAVENAFVSLDAGSSEVFEVLRGRGGGEDHFFAIKSGRDASIPVLGLKVGSYVPSNASRGLQSHSSLTVLVDDVTGRAYAVVEANYLNGLRTAAADALAVRELARPEAETLGIIGIGDQAVWEAIAVAQVRPIRRILAAGTSAARRALFAESLKEHLGIEPQFVDPQTAAGSADVLVTVTPARSPVIRADWVRPGTHISAMGADNKGKQELPLDLMRAAELWVDLPRQAIRIGETQHLFESGTISEAALEDRTLGRLLQPGFTYDRDPSALTVFDSSGLAIQDLAAAHAALHAVIDGRRCDDAS
jgi:ornithine cyclodeaminase